MASLFDERKTGYFSLDWYYFQGRDQPEEFNINSYKKVYILGHGSAGDNHITYGREYLGGREIISRMESMGLLSMRDIRLIPCYSADAQKITPTSPLRSNAGQGTSLLE
ncbi:hypothetical protein KEQ28_25565 [Escherichia coli]|nr:hypothetical protein [Escherichia coli]